MKPSIKAPAPSERAGVSLLGSAFGAGIFYGGLALVIAPLFGLAWFATRVAPISESAVLVLISSPIWFALIGSLFGALTAYVYNVLLRNMMIPYSTELKPTQEKDHDTAAGF